MNWRDALYHAVHDYLPGARQLAERMGAMTHQRLLNLVNPNDEAHEPSVRRFRQIVMLTGDLRPMHALAAEFGGVFVPVMQASASDDALMQTLAGVGKEFGDVFGALQEALKDKRISPRELDDFEQQVYELVQIAQVLRHQVRERAEAQPLFRAVKSGRAG